MPFFNSFDFDYLNLLCIHHFKSKTFSPLMMELINQLYTLQPIPAIHQLIIVSPILDCSILNLMVALILLFQLYRKIIYAHPFTMKSSFHRTLGLIYLLEYIKRSNALTCKPYLISLFS